MLPYTGDYIEHIEPGKNSLKFYSFTPRPLMRGHMYQMDDELAALLIDAHRNIGFLEGLIKYAPNKEAFAELMLLKECTYFDLLRSTQFSGGYIRWIKFFLNAVRETVKQTAKTLLQYEHLLERDQKLLASVEKLPPSIFLVYECLKKNPSVSSTFVAANINLSFNTISKDMHLLKESGIITQNGSGVRNHIWEYKSLYRALEIQEYSH